MNAGQLVIIILLAAIVSFESFFIISRNNFMIQQLEELQLAKINLQRNNEYLMGKVNHVAQELQEEKSQIKEEIPKVHTDSEYESIHPAKLLKKQLLNNQHFLTDEQRKIESTFNKTFVMVVAAEGSGSTYSYHMLQAIKGKHGKVSWNLRILGFGDAKQFTKVGWHPFAKVAHKIWGTGPLTDYLEAKKQIVQQIKNIFEENKDAKYLVGHR